MDAEAAELRSAVEASEAAAAALQAELAEERAAAAAGTSEANAELEQRLSAAMAEAEAAVLDKQSAMAEQEAAVGRVKEKAKEMLGKLKGENAGLQESVAAHLASLEAAQADTAEKAAALEAAAAAQQSTSAEHFSLQIKLRDELTAWKVHAEANQALVPVRHLPVFALWAAYLNAYVCMFRRVASISLSALHRMEYRSFCKSATSQQCLLPTKRNCKQRCSPSCWQVYQRTISRLYRFNNLTQTICRIVL